MRSGADGQRALFDALRREGGSVAVALREPRPAAHEEAEPGPAQHAAAGPRATGREADYELLLEMIYEGTRLHYGAPRVFATDDADLRLLLGDRLYAGGLARLAEIGDLEAVAELADLISLQAQAQARYDSELAAAVWAAGARAIGWGGSSEHEAAKALARSEDPDAQAALLRLAGPAGA
ncbi:MAG TPA: hypothetical protein VF781_11775 [Solirubrobacteraceae bacterium]